MTTLVGGLCGAGVFGLAMLVHGPSIFGICAGVVGAVLVSAIVGLALRGWVHAPVAAIASQRGDDSGPVPRAPEQAVGRLVRHIDDLDRLAAAERQVTEHARAALDADLARARAQAELQAHTLERQGHEAARFLRIQRLYLLVVEPILAQLGRAIERVIAIDTQPAAARPRFARARAAALWAEEALATLQHRQDVDTTPRAPVSLRDEIGTVARSIALGLGRELSLRFNADFPTLATAERTRLRLAMLAIAQCVAQRDPDGELVLDATFQDVGASGRLQISVDSRVAPQPALTSALDSKDEDVLALGELLGPVRGEVLVGADGHRMGFAIEAARQRRTSGVTLYGVGALSERSVLVIDPRPRGRALLCEQLVGWRMTPTATSDVASALEALELALRAKKPFDALLVCPRVPGLRSDGTPPELVELSRHEAFKHMKIVSLEAFDTLTASLPSEASELEPQRLARPAPPLEVLEALTLMLAPKPGSRTPSADKTRGNGGRSVLVVEDNPVNQALLAKMLERRGHQATVAPNGADAVDRLQEARGAFDIVLMDIQMPVMDGYEATTVIRMREAQDGMPHMPIVAVTAHAMSGEREKCLEAGMDGYLAKPVSEAELMSTIDEVLRRVHSPERKPAHAPAAPPPDVFDARRVLDFAAGDHAFLRTLVDIFAETTPKQMAAIEHAIAAQDGGALLRAAHQIKGSVGNFAADRARRLAAELEEQGRRKDFASAGRALDALRGEIDMLGQGLRRLINVD
ncbi:MAG: response regulator [Myxococcota bacterium]